MSKGDLSESGALCTGMGAASCVRQVDKIMGVWDEHLQVARAFPGYHSSGGL